MPKRVLAIFFLACGCAWGQAQPPSTYQAQLITFNGAPFGACDVYQVALNVSAGTFFWCNPNTHTWQSPFTNTPNFTQGLIAPTIGPSANQQHTIPAVASDTFALLGASQTFSGSKTFSQQITSSVATGTAPFSIASTTVTPNLNAQLLNGLTAPASAIVGINDTQTLTAKTLTAPVINGLNLPSSGVNLLNGQGNVGPITGNSSAQTVYTYTLPANTVGSLKAFRINLSYQHAGSASVTFATTFNGITMQSWSSTAAQGLEHLTLINTGSASCAIEGFALSNAPAVVAAGAGNVASGLSWASNQVITFTFNVANTDTVTGMQFVVEIIQ